MDYLDISLRSWVMSEVGRGLGARVTGADFIASERRFFFDKLFMVFVCQTTTRFTMQTRTCNLSTVYDAARCSRRSN